MKKLEIDKFKLIYTKLNTEGMFNNGDLLMTNISSSIQFDGSSNVSTEVEIADNSHNHTLENITDLQSNLDTINDNISTINGFKYNNSCSTTWFPIIIRFVN